MRRSFSSFSGKRVYILYLFILAGFSLGGRLPAYAQSSGELTEGERLLAAGNLTEAKAFYNEAVSQSGQEVAGRIGLARVFIGQRLWEPALNQIDKAVDRDPPSLQARYYKAIIHREIAKYDVLQAPKHRRRAFSLFEEIATEDSTFESVYFQEGLIHRYLEEYPEAITLGHRQIDIKDGDAEVHVGLHRMYRHFVEYEEEEAVKSFLEGQPYPYNEFFLAELDRMNGRPNFAAGRLDALLASDSLNVPVQPMLLARARLLYADRKPVKAQELVEQAIELINTEVEAAFVFEDFKFVLTDVELRQYRNLQTLDEKEAFFRAMWKERDPMPARTENVRLTEHYRRLLEAEKEYLYYGVRSWHNNPDPAGHLPFPAATYLNEEFNDKGLIFIRNGEPIDRVTHVGGPDNFFRTQIYGIESSNWMPSERTYNTGHALNESWRYVDPNLDFHFVVASNEENNWRLIPFLTSVDMLESREHWGDPYASMLRAIRGNLQMGQGAGNFAFNAELEDGSMEFASNEEDENAGGESISAVSNVQGQAMRFDLELEEARQEMIVRSQEAVELGLNTDRHTWEKDIEPMPIPNMIVSFKGVEGQTELDLYYALPIGKISEVDESESTKIPVESGYSILNLDWSVLDEQAVTRNLPRSEDETAAVIDFYRASAPPDSYMVALHGLPENSSLMGGYKFGYRVPDYSGNELMMSDLLLANNIELTLSGQTRFSRKGYKIQSNPFQRYSVNQIVYIYFELYNLTYDSKDQTRYDIEYILMPDKSEKGRLFRRRARPILSLKVERAGEMRSPIEYAEFDVQDVDPGKYEMTIRITDKVVGTSVEKSQKFELTQ